MLKTQFNRRWLLLAVVSLSVCVAGCHRGYYRRQADVEANRLVCEKSIDPRWDSEDGSIAIDPQSRMFDPFSADHPPLPPDDPSSHEYMVCVDGKRGYPHWEANGNTNYVANPEWRSYLPINEDGQVPIDLAGAYRLAVINSPDLQTQRENLYLSALNVSLERFGFDLQMFANFNSFLTTQGRFRNGGTSSTTLSNDVGIDFQKLGVTGASFVVGIANSILWNFAGTDTQSVNSLVDFSIVQPLLQNAGRDVIMESLTQSERTLLANVRALDRYRRGFYVQTVTGRRPGNGVNLGNNFLGLPDIASLNVDGYLGLLLQQQQIRIQEFNVTALENVLAQFREFYIRERVDSLQVRQFENSLYSAQQRLLRSKTNYESSLDVFKTNFLGLPPDLNVLIKDTALDQFKLISDEITERQNELNQLRNTTGDVLIELGDAIPDLPINLLGQPIPEEEANVQWPSDLNEKVAHLESYIDKAIELLRLVESRDREELQQDFARLDHVRPARVEYLNELRASIERGDLLSNIEPQILEANSIPTGTELNKLLKELVKRLDEYGKNLEEIKLDIQSFTDKRDTFKDNSELREFLRSNLLERIPEQLTNFSNTLLEMSLLQAEARANSVELSEVQLKSETASRIARCFRRDLMNARASLVDQWRQIEIFADQLESQFDLVLEGDMGNVGANPFNLRYENGSLRGGFRFDAPIVRLSERNNYRAALISYQQARRSFYQFEDQLDRNLRQILRNIDLNKVLFEVNRKSIQIRIEEVELARFKLEEPARPGDTRSALGATTANDLTRALDGLQTAQNDFLQVWVTYEVARRSLDFDLGTMQVDEMGNWIDPIRIDASIAARAASMMGISLECACQGAGVIPDFESDLDLVPEKPTGQQEETGTNPEMPGRTIEQNPDGLEPDGQNSLPFEPKSGAQPQIEQPGQPDLNGPSYFAPDAPILDFGFKPIPKTAPLPQTADLDQQTSSRSNQVRILAGNEPSTTSTTSPAKPSQTVWAEEISTSKFFFGPLDQLGSPAQSAAGTIIRPIATDSPAPENAARVIQVSNWTELPSQKSN